MLYAAPWRQRLPQAFSSRRLITTLASVHKLKQPNSRKILLVGLFFLLQWVTCLADAKKEIQAAYQVTYKAAALKYIHGMYAHRAPSFSGVDADGMPHNLKKERTWMKAFLDTALEIQELGTILDFRVIDEETVECRVEDTLHAVVFKGTRKLERKRLVMKTLSIDRWQRFGSEWKQVHCEVLDQSLQEASYNEN